MFSLIQSARNINVRGEGLENRGSTLYHLGKTEAQRYTILGEGVTARAEARSHCKGNSLKANLDKEVCVLILPGSESGCVVEVSTCVSGVWSVTPTVIKEI